MSHLFAQPRRNLFSGFASLNDVDKTSLRIQQEDIRVSFTEGLSFVQPRGLPLRRRVHDRSRQDQAAQYRGPFGS